MFSVDLGPAAQNGQVTTMRAFTAVVRGQVQGVGFRFTTRRLAAELGLVGWVRNRSDGAVEVWAQGPGDSLARLSAFLDDGPFGATVVSVETAATDPDPTLSRFEIRP